MGKRSLTVVTAVLITFLLSAVPACADGGLFGKRGRDISEPQQKAVIFNHEGTEELVLSVRYEGASEDFAWLVPTPEPPRIEEGDAALFEVMSAVTQAPPMSGWNRVQKDSVHLGGEAGIDVLDEMTVGAFDLTVLRAGDAGELRAWLEERGFAYDGEAEAVLAEYIERGWCFIAMRVNPSYTDAEYGSVEYGLQQGIIDPLRFTFDAPEPVYPLRISSLNPGETEVLLYVIAPQAYGHKSLELEYAERWQPAQVGALAEYSELAGKLEDAGGCCVTKLRRTFSPEDMLDLYLTPVDEKELAAWAGFASAGNNGWPWWALLAIVLGLGALGAAAYGIWGRRGSGWPRRAAGVFLAAALVSAAVVFPLGLWLLPGEEEVDAAQHADWPWRDDILVNHNGWSKLVHPDGGVEVLGLVDWRTPAAYPAGPKASQEYEPAVGLISVTYELGGEDGWKWGVREEMTEAGGVRSLVVEDSESGEAHKTQIGAAQVHAARRSPGGDRLWVALNPGVPVNKTEVREYIFPSLELVRSVIHDCCLDNGEIVMSLEGDPLIAGRFRSGEEYADTIFGFLPMLENDAGFTGRTIEVKGYGREPGEDELYVTLLNGFFCDAVDGSPLLLLAGSDIETGEGVTFVLDTGDGEFNEVCKGYPLGWR